MNNVNHEPFITIIVAIAKNRVIGNKGQLPWYIIEDLKRFKKLTLKNPVLMGRKTYDSIVQRLGKGLPERENLILTRQKDHKDFEQNIHFFNEISEVFYWMHQKKYKNLFIAGGTSVYNKFLPIAKRIEVTHVQQNFEGDTFFPHWNKKHWLTTRGELKKDSKSGLEYYFCTYDRN